LVEYAVPGEWRLTEAIGSTQEAADIAGVLLTLKAFGLRDVEIFVKQGLKEVTIHIHGVDLKAHQDGMSKEEGEILKT